MDWKAHIVTDPGVLGGKPVIRGTRLAVDFLLELLAEGWSPDQLRQEYPQLSAASLQAVFAYAAALMREPGPTPVKPDAT